MGTEEGSSERTAYSGPLNKRATRKSSSFGVSGGSTSGKSSDEAYVEIVLDVRDDSVAVHSIKDADGQDVEDPEVTLLSKGLEKKSSSSSLGSSVLRSASTKIKQELKRLASLSFSKREKGPPATRPYDRNKSAAAHALKGLKFISKADGGNGWLPIENRFHQLTASTGGSLPRSLFGECIGLHTYYFVI